MEQPLKNQLIQLLEIANENLSTLYMINYDTQKYVIASHACIEEAKKIIDNEL